MPNQKRRAEARPTSATDPNTPIPLNYGRPDSRPDAPGAVAAFTWGLLSGPVVILIGLPLGALSEFIGDLCVFLGGMFLLAAFIYGCIVRFRLPPDVRPSARWFATFGMLLPIGWGFLIVTVFFAIFWQ